MKILIFLLLFIFISSAVSCKENQQEPSNLADDKNQDVIPAKAGIQNKTEIEAPKNVGKEKFYNLQLSWNNNRIRIHNSESETRLAYKLSNREIIQKSISKNTYSEVVTKIIDAQTAEITSTFDWFQRKSVDVEGKESIIDTATETKNDEISYKIFRSIVGASLLLTLNSKAVIQKIKGSDVLLNRSMTALFGKYWYQNAKSKDYEKALKQTYNEKDLIQQFSEGFFDLPDKPVKIGDSWVLEINHNISIIGDIAFAVTMKLNAVEAIDNKEFAIIEMMGEYNNKSESNIINESCEISTGSYVGTLKFNITQGEFGDFSREILVKAALTDKEKVTIYTFSDKKLEAVKIKQ